VQTDQSQATDEPAACIVLANLILHVLRLVRLVPQASQPRSSNKRSSSKLNPVDAGDLRHPRLSCKRIGENGAEQLMLRITFSNKKSPWVARAGSDQALHSTIQI
jgi:hypothetical protein